MEWSRIIPRIGSRRDRLTLDRLFQTRTALALSKKTCYTVSKAHAGKPISHIPFIRMERFYPNAFLLNIQDCGIRNNCRNIYDSGWLMK